MDREMGSRGKDVAALLAEKLNAALILYEIIDHLADRMRVRKSHVVRLLEDGEDLDAELTPEATMPAILSAQELLELAALPEPVVLRGWGGTALLREVGHVVRVRITSPYEARIATLKGRVRQPDEEKIRTEIANSDEAHLAIMRRHFGVDYHDSSLYHLVLDTSETPIEECVNRIIALSFEPRFAETDASRDKLASLAIETHVKALLKLHPPTRNIAIGVVAAAGQVTLTGAVPNDEIKLRCEHVAWRVPGMTAVDNQLQVAEAGA
jgi:cytidylate kinase